MPDRNGEYPVKTVFWVEREGKLYPLPSVKAKDWRHLDHIIYTYADGTTEKWNNDGTPIS